MADGRRQPGGPERAELQSGYTAERSVESGAELIHVDLAALPPGFHALDIKTVVEEEAGLLQEEVFSAFLELKADGTSRLVGWKDYACGSGRADCFTDPITGKFLISLMRRSQQ